ncbi:hypothetical protein GXM_06882 [Nostoc sphaeroides CCNUC1]|uniref:Uncharacterized protein n=1 Tax=Nostoc sphaeroides CCNUC1 TaxID=2653204 RepID=A0A5P8W9H2_9NOSO|nr:hypothetical protein GXM_06882 [Nostoc sphaeroides CCNUC1]
MEFGVWSLEFGVWSYLSPLSFSSPSSPTPYSLLPTPFIFIKN